MSSQVADTFHRAVEEGHERLHRPWPGLIATGFVGGADVSVGLLAFLIVQQQTGNHLLASLAFGIGFVALTLASSELFTENFLVPITAVAAKKASWVSVLRLWFGTAVSNLLGAWLIMGLVVWALPDLRSTARELAAHPIEIGTSWVGFAAALLAGMTMTLMTWMERATESVGAKLVAAWSIAFVLVAAPLQHSILASAESFAALHAGADFSYLGWFKVFVIAALGNAVAGTGLVTVLRLVQVGKDQIEEEQAKPIQ